MKKATQEQTKEHNRRLVLRTIYDRSTISRADLSRLTSLTPTTISKLIQELIDQNLVIETGFGASSGGKRPTLLSFAAGAFAIAALDLADVEFRAALLDLRGQVMLRASRPAAQGPAAIVAVNELLTGLLEGASTPLLGIAAGCPGLIDTHRGMVLHSVNLGWNDVPLRSHLARQFNLPVLLGNDAHLAAFAEYNRRRSAAVNGESSPAEEEARSLVVIKAGRDIGAGIVLDGRIYAGEGFGAGEIGHTRAANGSLPCRCGHTGCLTTVASAQALLKRAAEFYAQDPASPLHASAASPGGLTLEELENAFHRGDPRLQAALDSAGAHLGYAAAHIVGLLNVNHIVLSGALAAFAGGILPAMRRALDECTLDRLASAAQVSASTLGTDGVLLGAAFALLEEQLIGIH